MEEKIFKTYEEQIEILRARGLIVNNEKFFKDCMEHDDYYNVINGYKKYFLTSTNPEHYRKGVKFEHIQALYSFDQNIRGYFLLELLKIEKYIKSIIAYHFSAKYGHDHRKYLNIKNFKNDTVKNRSYAIKTIENIKLDISRYQKLSAIKHYLADYGYIPLWVLNSVLSFGRIANLYVCLKLDMQQVIAGHFKLSAAEFCGFLYFLDDWRNTCAHGGRVYTNDKQKRYQKIIPNTKYHALLGIPKNNAGNYISGKTDVTAMLIALKLFCTAENFHCLKEQLGCECIKLKSAIPEVVMINIEREMGNLMQALDKL